jgi:hypothetical protein
VPERMGLRGALLSADAALSCEGYGKMDVPKRVLTISKAEGASRQVDEAIRALQRGDFDIAVTLAGAAEGMFDRKGLHLWNDYHAKAPAADIQGKELSDHLNAARHWLKHPVPEQGESLELDRGAAVQMTMRAMTQLATWSPLMNEFKAYWLYENVDSVFDG